MSAPQPSSGGFEGKEHHLPVRVYYEDTDFTGVVYHANYLRFFERGRSEFLRCCGLDHAQLMALPDPAAFAVAHMEIDFKAPARIDDALVVRTRFAKAGRASLGVSQTLFRDKTVIARASLVLVCIGAEGRSRRPPAELLSAVAPWLDAPATP